MFLWHVEPQARCHDVVCASAAKRLMTFRATGGRMNPPEEAGDFSITLQTIFCPISKIPPGKGHSGANSCFLIPHSLDLTSFHTSWDIRVEIHVLGCWRRSGLL